MPAGPDRYRNANLTVPNVLTAMRIVMAVVAAVFFAVHTHEKLAVVLCVVATLLDAFDGWYARTFSQCSRLGEHLDPLADKMLIAVMYTLIAFKTDSLVVWLLVIAIAVREIGITLLRSYSLRRHKKFIPANSFGKAKMISQSTFGAAVIVYAYFGNERFSFPETIMIPSMTVIMLISYYSALVYLKEWRRAKAVPLESVLVDSLAETRDAKKVAFGE